MATTELRARWPGGCHCLRVGPLQIDLDLRRICRPDGETELPQRCFDLLLLLLAEPDAVHSRSTLLARVWTGVIVEDANLSQAVWTLRRALGHGQRDWIRTVAKSGYVFQPGMAVEVVAAAARAASLPTATVAPSPSPRPPRWHLAAAALLMLATVLLGWHSNWFADAAAPTQAREWPAHQVLGVVELSDSGAAPAGRWPATVLRAWCEWQLGMQPEVLLLKRDQLATADTRAPAHALLLVSSGQLAGTPVRWFVQLRLQRPGQADWQQRIEADAEDLPARMQGLSDALLAQLPLRHDPRQWPTLDLDAAAGAALADFLSARESLQWSKAASLGRALLPQAPRFVPLRMELAAILSRLGQVHEANAQAGAALPQLGRLPAPVARQLAAQLAAWRRDPQQAAQAYASLAAEYPRQPAFRMEHARALLALDRAADALALLDQVDGPAQPVAIRTAGWLLKSQAQRQLGDGVAAQASARQALALAQQAGWPLEAGLAQFQSAAAGVIASRALPDGDGFDAAQASFLAAGDQLRAQEARLHALSHDRGDAATVDRELAVLLAQAHAVGHRGLEIDALRSVAFRDLRSGDLQGYRDHLEQAAAVAQASGDTLALSRMDLYLVPLDLDAGRYDEAAARLQRIAALGLQGEPGYWAAHFGQFLAWRRGDLAQVGRALAARDGAGLVADGATVQALTQCNQAQLALVQGDLESARAGFARCGQSPAPVYQLQALAGLARLDLVGGDRNAALLQIGALSRRLPDLSNRIDRLGLELELAELLWRAGELEAARNQYRQWRPALKDSGLRVIDAETTVGLARIAVAQGRWQDAATLVASARTLAPPDDWPLALALGQLDVLALRRRGEAEAAGHALSRLEQRARQYGDRFALAEIHALVAALALELPCCGPMERAALLGESGMRGVRWELAAVDRVR